MVSAITATTSTHPPNPKTSSSSSSSSQQQQQQQHINNQTRSPLLPSERDNGVVSKRPKSKEITSRYMSSSSSSSSSKRFPSPSLSSTRTTTPLPSVRRSQSVERNRPITPNPRPITSRPTTPLPNSRPVTGNAASQQLSSASKLLLSSTRRLSVSFQGESYSLPVSKIKASPVSNSIIPIRRASTPERKKVTPLGGKVGGGGDQVENSKPIDQHRWPARTRQVNPLTKSMDCTAEKNNKLVGSASVTRVLKQSMIDLSRRASLDYRLNPKFGGSEISKTVQLSVVADTSHGSLGSDDLIVSDTDSVSSGSNSSSQEWSGIAQGRGVTRGISVPARFWQETNSRMRRLQEPGSPLTRSPGSKPMIPTKFVPLKKTLSETSLSSPKNVPMSRTMSSPMRGPGRPSSPSRLMAPPTSSPSRGSPSPSRMRNAVAGAGNSQLSNIPSILSFVVDSPRGKLGENRIMDAHLLRLLYNRQLQWRFINARADAVLFLKRITVEKNLYNAWVTTSELHDSITIKRIKLHLLRQNLKLTSILKGQVIFTYTFFDTSVDLLTLLIFLNS
ncbi:hypothetical protein AQUCO_01700032v1 [Aquilegia coerulea]|uniref:Uncharacterized protein n=1 Tax=Aquilegia coerulea TaxID=218851 RepID=A0A2G5DKT0_AQUCA|nr:hypothetical protein AQUCO_01700032v1 [Aquilegia coerulea]